MPSTYTDNDGLELQATGENENTWGIRLNTVIEILDSWWDPVEVTDTSGTTTLGIPDGTTTDGEGRALYIDVTETLTGDLDIEVPDSKSRIYIVEMSGTLDGNTCTFKTENGSGISLSEDAIHILRSNGTDVLNIFTFMRKDSVETSSPSTNAITEEAVVNYVENIEATPPGALMPFARTSAPSGWLECDGSEVSRTTYSSLFSAIGTNFGNGDGSTTFDLPDLRGEFIRGWDNGRGVDSGRSFGTSQSGEFESHDHDGSTGTDGNHNHGGNTGGGGGHTHTGSTTTNGNHNHGNTTGTDGNHSHTGSTTTNGDHSHDMGSTTSSSGSGVGAYNADALSGRVPEISTGTDGAHNHSLNINANGNHNHHIPTDGNHNHSLDINSNGNHNHNITTDGNHSHTISSAGGSETRPRNIALMYCIKT